MRKSFLLFILFFISISFFYSESPIISSFTEEKVEEFIDYRIALKSVDHDEACKEIEKIMEETLSELPNFALDFEQEEFILETVYYMEIYEHLLNSVGNQKKSRAKLKQLMKKGFACIDDRKKSKISDWTYQFAADVTSYYMTRSVAATFFYGLKVKGYYENALEINKNRATASVCLGNWRFYAPGFAGGGKKKAKKHFENAINTALLDGEKYLAYIGFSQINYEMKNFDVAKEYLEKAVELGFGQKEIDKISKCNLKGYSYFQYLRNRSGIDEEMSEDEKDDEDR